jgi:hypothetical protein
MSAQIHAEEIHPCESGSCSDSCVTCPFGIDDWTDTEDFMTDGEADADALASAGWGMDEDYGGPLSF